MLGKSYLKILYFEMTRNHFGKRAVEEPLWAAWDHFGECAAEKLLWDNLVNVLWKGYFGLLRDHSDSATILVHMLWKS